MNQTELRAETRNIFGKKTRRLRRAGAIPGTLYGPRTEPVSVQMAERDLHRVLGIAGETQLISLLIDGADEPRMILAREVQRDPITHSLVHVDLYEVVMTEKITAEVPLNLVGESPIAARKTGLLMRGLDTVQVHCLPGDLTASIDVDLSALEEVDQAILVKDLVVDPSIEVLTSPDEVVVKLLPIKAPMLEEEAAAEVEGAEVEVITGAREVEMEGPQRRREPEETEFEE
jgi:large subunit ribosomal protein L25